MTKNMDAKKIVVQIYEIQEPGEVEALVETGVDHIGSVLLESSSWKQSKLKDTLRVVADSPAKSSLIPLFSAADDISRVLDYYQPDIIHMCEMVQLGGQLEKLVETQRIVRRRFPEIEIMRSIPISRPGRDEAAPLAEVISAFEPFSDWFLTDTLLPPPDKEIEQAQPVAGFVGITGLTCDWEVAAQLVKSTAVPVILAGGLAGENVYDGILQTKPVGVDSCTLTNLDDGHGQSIRFKKDMDKVAHFIQEVNRAEADGLA